MTFVNITHPEIVVTALDHFSDYLADHGETDYDTSDTPAELQARVSKTLRELRDMPLNFEFVMGRVERYDEERIEREIAFARTAIDPDDDATVLWVAALITEKERRAKA